jgi:hypothetical protein
LPYVLLGASLLALLVWMRRRASRPPPAKSWARVLLAVIAAAAALVTALRGGWIVSLVLIGLSARLVQPARARPDAPPAARAEMDVAQACSILGVAPAAGRPEIVAAYRRLMRRAHPDVGGTAGLASQLTAARDRLLGRRGEA